MNKCSNARNSIKNQRVWSRKDKLDYLKTYIDSADERMLEIGPSIAPIWSASRYENVRYLETVDALGLQERAKLKGKTSPIEEVHYVFDGDKGFEGSINNSVGYKYISSSHVIEHIPDFVGHLQSIQNICAKDGYYFAIVPDKNLIFDKARPCSSIGDMLSVYIENRSAFGSAVDELYYSLKVKETGRGWWNSNSDPILECRTKRNSLEKTNLEHLKSNKLESWTGHHHVFDPFSFSQLIDGLRLFGIVNLSLCDLVSTGHMDFIAVLKNDNGSTNISLQRVAQLLKMQNYPFQSAFHSQFSKCRNI